MKREIYKDIFKGMPGFASLENQGGDIRLIIERSPLNTGVSLSVYTPHEVRVKTGDQTSMTRIIAFIVQHRRFILNRIYRYQKKEKAERTIPLFANGETIKLFGKSYVVVRRGDVGRTKMSGNKIFVPLGATRFSELNDDISRLAYCELKAMTDAYADLYGFSYSSIHINERRTAWGVCDNHKCIGFNISLAFLPEALVEYVVVHELAHTREMNHGKNFWMEVERVLPNYKELQEALRNYNIEWYLSRIA